MYITYYLKYGRVRPNQIGDPKSVTDFNLKISAATYLVPFPQVISSRKIACVQVGRYTFSLPPLLELLCGIPTIYSLESSNT